MREFDSPAAFALHLLAVSYAIHKAEQAGLERVAKLIEKDAKDRIGHYQAAIGPFPEWEPLADSTEYEKSRAGYPVDAPLLRTGEMRESIEHEVARNEAVIGSKQDKAAWQEFGTDSIPPRPFIGPAAFNNRDKIEQILGEALVQGLTGGEVIHAALGYDMEI